MQKFFDKFITSPESGAIMLTLSQTIHDEEQIKEFLKNKGFLCAVTEIGGNSSYPEFQEKITHSVISASIKCGIIKRVDKEVHAVLHAAEEAKRGFLVVSFSTNVSLKVGIVRKYPWVTVAIYGQTAGHSLTNHYRIGLGVMHI